MGINDVIRELQQGGVVILPTDTNYNVFTRINSAKGVKRIFQMKQRHEHSPLSLCFEQTQAMDGYVYLNKSLQNWLNDFWPAPISFIVRKKNIVPDYVTCGFQTAAIACHQHPILTTIIKAIGEPLAGTSANLSGTGLVKNIVKAIAHIGDAVDGYIDAGNLSSNSSNTIVDLSFYPPILARQGDYPTEKIQLFIKNLCIHYTEEEYKNLVRNRFITQQEVKK